jgi:hypothetical protein
MFRADAHFRMGTSHEAEGSPCQDYSLADNGLLPFAVVSDGCSTSGRTDIGSRLWCLSAMQMRRYRTPKYEMDARSLLSSSMGVVMDARRTFNLRDADLDATLGGVFARADGRVRGILFGDGVFAAKTPEGTEITVIEWAGNMPGYPSYLLSQERRRMFIEQSDLLAADSVWPCLMTHTSAGIISSYIFSADDGLNGIELTFPVDTEIAAVMTDGVGQISDLDLQTVVTELLSFSPAREGHFAKRRLNMALKRWAKDGHRPVDDISIAALVRVDV